MKPTVLASLRGILPIILLGWPGCFLTAQIPQLTRIEWRNVSIEEKAAAIDAMIAAGELRQAASASQTLIDIDLEPTAGTLDDPAKWPAWNLMPDRQIPGLYLSPSYQISRRIAGRPADLLPLYRNLYDKQAEEALRRARRLGATATLRHLARRFPVTVAGSEALELIARRSLAAGEIQAAALFFGDLLDLDWHNESRRGPRQAGYALALSLAKDAGSLKQLNRGIADVSLRLAGQERSLRNFLDATLRTVSVTGSRLSSLAGGTPTLGGEAPKKVAQRWQVKTTAGAGDWQALLNPVLCGENVVFHSRAEVVAVDRRTGARRWSLPFSETPPAALPVMDDNLFDDLRGGGDKDLYLMVSGWEGGERDEPTRRLTAIHPATGKIAWQVDGDEIAVGLPDLLFDGAPLLAGDRIYLTATDRNDDVGAYVLALDRARGTLIWCTRIGSGVALSYRTDGEDVPDRRRWLGSLPLALSQGMLICCDNLGHIAVLEAENGRPRFLFNYLRRKITSENRLGESALERGWEQNPILACGDRFVVAADDSDSLQAFFLRPPRDARRRRENLNYHRAATIPRRDLTQIIGFDGQNAFLGGFDALEQVHLAARIPVFVSTERGRQWSYPLESALTGRGYFGQKSVYYSSHKYVYCIDMETGTERSALVRREADGLEYNGHLLVVPGGIITASRNAVTLYGESN